MELALKGRRVLVTGASRGIGAAIAEAFAREGCHLDLVARSAEGLAALAQRLQAAHAVEVRTLALDMRAPDALARIVEQFGAADVLVNNAGDVPHGSLEKIDEATWRNAWELKVFGYINLTRALYQRMRERGDGGVIVNIIGIIGGERVMADYIAGTAGNAALSALTRALGADSPDHGIRVVAVHPGLVLTDRQLVRWRERATAELGDPERWQELTRIFPFGRLGRAEEVANAVVFLASSAASYVSGAALTVDGGFSQRLQAPYKTTR